MVGYFRSLRAALFVHISGSIGSTNNQLSRPRGVTLVESANTLYVADTDNHRVMSYQLGSLVGILVAGGQGRGVNNTQLSDPWGISFDAETNSLFIANFGSHTIVRWRLGASSWTLVVGDINGLPGRTPSALNAPTDFMLDVMGNMYVAEYANYRVQFFLAGESSGSTIAGVTGVLGSNSSLISSPHSVALDSQLNLYVADCYNQRVQKFSRY
jgi:DNA-binding beta-propeller fold protein YncE